MAQVPAEETSVQAQVRQAIDAAGVSVAELGRRLARADGGNPESKRRWLMKLLSGGVETPEQESLDGIALALGLDAGSLTTTTRARAAARRADLEEEVADLRRAVAVLLRAVLLLEEQAGGLGDNALASELQAVQEALRTPAGSLSR